MFYCYSYAMCRDDYHVHEVMLFMITWGEIKIYMCRWNTFDDMPWWNHCICNEYITKWFYYDDILCYDGMM